MSERAKDVADTKTDEEDISSESEKEWPLQYLEKDYFRLCKTLLKENYRYQDVWRKEAASHPSKPEGGGGWSNQGIGNAECTFRRSYLNGEEP